MPGPAHIALLQNAALLLAMVVVFDLVTGRLRLESKPAWQVLVGAILGGLGIGLMLAAFRLESGIIFDTRSVLLSMAGLFFGTIPTLVAMAMTATFRLWQGGAAAWTGVFVILATGCLGIFWRRYRQGRLEEISARELYVFGVVVHLVMLALMLTLPWATARRVLAGIGLPVLVVYPLATAALGLLLANRLRREHLGIALAESEERYRSLFENNHATMLIINPADGAIVDANPAACRFYGWTREQLRQMRIHQINTLPPDQLRAEMDRARAKEDYHFLFTHRRADGSLRDVEVFSGPVSTGDQHLLCSIIHDITERTQAEQALRDSEERLRLALDAAQMGTFDWDIPGQRLAWSVWHERLWGYQPGEFNGTFEAFLHRLHPDDRPLLETELARCRANRVPFRWEFRVIWPDGSVHWVSGAGQFKYGTDNQPTRMRGTVMEVTRRKQAEAERTLLANTIAASVNEIYLFDADTWHFRFVSAGALKNLGFTMDQMRTLTPLDLKPEMDRAAFEKLTRPLLRQEQTMQFFETVHRRADGSCYPVEVRLQLFETDNDRVFLAVIQDITERKRAERSLVASERRYRALFENMTAGFVLFEVVQDDQGQPVDLIILAGNKGFEATTGLKLQEVAGKRLTRVLPGIEKDAADWIGTYGRVALTGESKQFEQGSELLGVYYSVIAYQAEPKQCAVTFVDITERKKAEEALRQRNEELVRFTYTVSHDLKSPLVTIQTFLGYLEKDLQRADADRIQSDMGHIRRAAAKMLQLLEELLELSRIGRKMNTPEDVSLQVLAREAQELVAGQIAERRVQVTVTDAPIVLHGDRRRLLEVFQNLLDNAVKFMGNQPAPRIEIGFEETGAGIVLFVRDNGLGIDPRHQAKLFGLFEKLHPGTPGTGIGLALVKRIVEVHDGRIWAESPGPGLGSTFRFTLRGIKRIKND